MLQQWQLIERIKCNICIHTYTCDYRGEMDGWMEKERESETIVVVLLTYIRTGLVCGHAVSSFVLMHK